MHSESTLRFVPLLRLGETRFGIAPSWLPAQALGVLGFGLLAYATVAQHLGESLDPLGALRVALVLMAALDLTILVHEAGHAVAASMAGVSVRAIVLMAYGGATIRAATSDRSVARWTAVGGPLANLIAAALCALSLASIDSQSALGCALMITGAFQAISGLTNLVPFACLDGARIFAPAH